MRARRALLYMPGDNRYKGNEGRCAFALDGRMIGMPLVNAARNVLARAHAAGKN